MAGCSKCGGKGYFKTIVQEGGVCYRCDGLGDEKLAREQRKVKKANSDKKFEQELKELIAGIYLKVQAPRIIGGEKCREALRAEAAGYYATLKEKGITLTLEEIKTIAEKIS